MTLFSNGTEGLVWQEVWCNLCVYDHDFHDDVPGTPGCEVWFRALDTNDPEQVTELVATGEPLDVRARWYCTSFTPCGLCGGEDPHVEGRARLRLRIDTGSTPESRNLD